MSRKSLIICLSILAAMVLGLGLAVAFLYSGSGTKADAVYGDADASCYRLLPAVPSDALAIFCHKSAEDADTLVFPPYLMKAAASFPVAVSYHHSGAGRIDALYIFDSGRTSEESSPDIDNLISAAKGGGLYAETASCSDFPKAGKHLKNHSVVIVSKYENLVRSSLRHLEEGISVIDASGFSGILGEVVSDDLLFVSNRHLQRIAGTLMTRKLSRHSSFLSKACPWTVFDISDYSSISGYGVSDGGPESFLTVLAASEPETTKLSDVLPSYTIYASSISVGSVDSYLEAYSHFKDSGQKLAAYESGLSALKKNGTSKEEFLYIFAPEEIARASFKVKGILESVNMIRTGKNASFRPEDGMTVSDFPYDGYISAIFGSYFDLADESCFAYVDGWVISGNRQAVSEFVSGSALEYTLKDMMADAGQKDLLASAPAVFTAYFSFTEDREVLEDIFNKPMLSYLDDFLSGADYSPFVFKVLKGKEGLSFTAGMLKCGFQRTKAPVVERDTTVFVPEGPFEVKNSGTGKMNSFYQNSHLSLCLSEDGKDLWGIPFKEKICGYAQTIDYYANGKLQILFGAGSSLYLIDRLGRFVNGFPVDLGKEILLGPQPYDFNGTHRYNVMVLLKDGSLQMYNLKGHKPDSWKGIRTEETIKSLPELIKVGGRSFWVVRTSVQTLVFPFDGGEPLTVFEGDEKIRPDSPVTAAQEGTIEVECYDGRRRTVKLV